jgi:hypothetical protein
MLHACSLCGMWKRNQSANTKMVAAFQRELAFGSALDDDDGGSGLLVFLFSFPSFEPVISTKVVP